MNQWREKAVEAGLAGLANESALYESGREDVSHLVDLSVDLSSETGQNLWLRSQLFHKQTSRIVSQNGGLSNASFRFSREQRGGSKTASQLIWRFCPP